MVVTFRKSPINSNVLSMLLHRKTATKGSLSFIHALWMGTEKVGPSKYCEKQSLIRMWSCPSERERSTSALVNMWFINDSCHLPI